MIYALDANTLSFILKEDENVKRSAIAALDNGDKFVIPQISDYEVRRGLLAQKMTKKLREYMNFRENAPIGLIDSDVWNKAIQIYVSLSQKGKPIEDADILTAAFCIVNGCTLVTNNTRHFVNIGDLRYIDWKQ